MNTFSPTLSPTWTAPDGLAISRHRVVRLTAGGLALLALSAAFLVGSVVAVIALQRFAARRAEEFRMFQTESAVTQATVTELLRGSESNRTVAYMFSVDGRTYRGSSRIRRRRWEALSVGDALPVRYIRYAPQTNVPDGLERNPMPWIVTPAVGAGLAALAWATWYPIRRQRRLLTEGRVAPATVTKHEKQDKGVVIHYGFPMLNGSIAKGQSTAGKEPVAVGSVLTVLYDPENSRRYALYPLSLVRLAFVPRPPRR